MNIKKFVIVVVIATIFSTLFAREYASPSRVGRLKYPNGYKIMYEGSMPLSGIRSENIDGTYYGVAYWYSEYIWGMKTGNKSSIWINIVDWFGELEPSDRMITFGDVYEGTLLQEIFDSITYSKYSVPEAYIKIEIRDNKLIKIWTDDDDWRQFAKKIGW